MGPKISLGSKFFVLLKLYHLFFNKSRLFVETTSLGGWVFGVSGNKDNLSLHWSFGAVEIGALLGQNKLRDYEGPFKSNLLFVYVTCP